MLYYANSSVDEVPQVSSSYVLDQNGPEIKQNKL